MLICNFSLIICFALWGIKIITLSGCIKKGISSMIDNFLNNIFLFRRHYTELIFKYSQLPLLSIGSNGLSITEGRQRHNSVCSCGGLGSTDTNQRNNVPPDHCRGGDQTPGVTFLCTNAILPVGFSTEGLHRLFVSQRFPLNSLGRLRLQCQTGGRRTKPNLLPREATPHPKICQWSRAELNRAEQS